MHKHFVPSGLREWISMNDIRELKRLDSPAPKPQSLAWDGATLWMGSRDTRRIYQISPATWTVARELAAHRAHRGE